MSSCERCSLPADPTTAPGTLFLSPPLVHTLRAIKRSFAGRDIPFQEQAGNILSVAFEPADIEKNLETIAQGLSDAELRDTRSLILPRGATATIVDLMRTMPLSILISKVQERWLLEMLRERRLTTHFQPIVRAKSPTEVYAYECLLRGRKADGTLVAPTPMYAAARDAELLFQLDRAARLTAIREAVQHRVAERLFINFNPSSIYDPSYCLKTTISAIESTGIDPSRVVFEVVESDHVDVDLLGIVTSYRRAGFRVALDDLGEGYGSLNLLSRLKPDIVKLDMKLVRDVDRDRFKAGIASKLLEMARELGIATVAEGIETRGEFEWFRDQGVDFLQGYYIARPASPPPRLAQAPVVPAPVLSTT